MNGLPQTGIPFHGRTDDFLELKMIATQNTGKMTFNRKGNLSGFKYINQPDLILPVRNQATNLPVINGFNLYGEFDNLHEYFFVKQVSEIALESINTARIFILPGNFEIRFMTVTPQRCRDINHTQSTKPL